MKSTITIQLNHLRIAPRKTRSVADLIRGLPLDEAQAQLMFSSRRSSGNILKLLKSGRAQIKELLHVEPSQCYIKEIRVDNGPFMKRWTPRARGSMSMIQKKSSHITLTIGVMEKPKESRFTFTLPEKKKKKEKKEKVQKQKEEKASETHAHDHEIKEQKKLTDTTTPEKGFIKRTFRRKAI